MDLLKLELIKIYVMRPFVFTGMKNMTREKERR